MEEKQLRTQQEVNMEYQGVCAVHGDASFKLENLSKELERLKELQNKQISKMRELAAEKVKPAEVEASKG